MEMTYDGALVLPSNCVTMDEEEMTYTDGGFGIANWIVSGTINVAISAALASCGVWCGARGLKYLSRASKVIFASKFRKQLFAKGIAYSIAAVGCAWMEKALTFISGICDPGQWIASQIDSHDCRGRNGVCDIW